MKHSKLTVATAVAVSAMLGIGAASAADLPMKALPPVAPPLSWTGFYAGFNVGYAWADNSVNFSGNDPLSAALVAGTNGASGEQPLPGAFGLRPNGATAGLQAGYNWRVGSNWLWGVETDFNSARNNDQAAGSSIFLANLTPPITQMASVQQTTEWYGTVRGRLGWLATPDILFFGTGGFAYGRVTESASFQLNGQPGGVIFNNSGFSAVCQIGTPCATGTSAGTRTGWAAGGGAEWLFNPHWSFKAEYQFVDLGTQTVTSTALVSLRTPTSFNVAFRDQIQIVRVGLNWHP